MVKIYNRSDTTLSFLSELTIKLCPTIEEKSRNVCGVETVTKWEFTLAFYSVHVSFNNILTEYYSVIDKLILVM